MVCALETTKPATIRPFLRRCGDQHMHEIPAYSMNEFHEVMSHYKKIEYVSIDDSTPFPLLSAVLVCVCPDPKRLLSPPLLAVSSTQPRRRRRSLFISSATACRAPSSSTAVCSSPPSRFFSSLPFSAHPRWLTRQINPEPVITLLRQACTRGLANAEKNLYVTSPSSNLQLHPLV
jgi:hypothetical protein